MARSKVSKSSGRVRRASKGASKRKLPSTVSFAGLTVRVLDVLCGTLLAAVVFGLFERFIWLGAIARELGPLLIVLALCLAITTACLRRWRWTAALVAAWVIALWPAWPLLRPVRLTSEHGPLLRVAEATLDGAEVSLERVQRLRDTPLDLLAVVGATDSALRALDSALPNLPYRARRLGKDGKQALWSRMPLRGVTHEPVARLRVGACDVQVVIMSVPSRLRLSQQAARVQAVRAIEQQDDSARAIWLGALGSRPQSSDLAQLNTKQRLRDTRLGHGILASTPSWLGPLGLSMDHVLVRGWIAVRERSAQPALGDGAHTTQRATLELTEPRCRAVAL